MYKTLLLSSLLVLMGAGCAEVDFESKKNSEPQIRTHIELVDETQYSKAITLLEYAEVPSHDSFMALYRVDPKLVTMEFSNDLEAGSAVDWQKSTGADLVVNGVYFHEDKMPSGMFIEDGKFVGARQFDLDRTAFIELSPSVSIVDTAKIQVNFDDVQSGAQTYPLLFKNGEGAIKEDSALRARRTFIATDKNGFIYFGVIVKSDVSLYEMMILLDGIQDWDEVANLDGGPSSGIASSYGGSINSLTSIPSVILVKEKDR